MAYAALFCVAVAMVLRGIPYWLGLIVIVAALLVLDRRALLGVDWGLLVIFAAFFTFSGNMARIEPVRELFRKLLAHGVMPVAALTSQVISNVPAAILLSRFTDDYPGLLVGVNIGGVGTLVASLASLIPSGSTQRTSKARRGASWRCSPSSALAFCRRSARYAALKLPAAYAHFHDPILPYPPNIYYIDEGLRVIPGGLFLYFGGISP